MIKIEENRCEFQYAVDTDTKKAMNMLSPTAFEQACISYDVRKLMVCIDSKYGKGCALKMFGMIVADIYTNEEIEQAEKEIKGNE